MPFFVYKSCYLMVLSLIIKIAIIKVMKLKGRE